MPCCSTSGIDNCSALMTVLETDGRVETLSHSSVITIKGYGPASTRGSARDNNDDSLNDTGCRDKSATPLAIAKDISCHSLAAACDVDQNFALATSALFATCHGNARSTLAADGCTPGVEGACCKAEVTDRPPVSEPHTPATHLDENNLGSYDVSTYDHAREETTTRVETIEDDKTSLCSCCVTLLLKNDDDKISSPVSENSEPIARLTMIIENVTYRLRMCCILLEKAACSGKLCCYQPVTVTKPECRVSAIPLTTKRACDASFGRSKEFTKGATCSFPKAKTCSTSACDSSPDATCKKAVDCCSTTSGTSICKEKVSNGCCSTVPDTSTCKESAIAPTQIGDLNTPDNFSGPIPVVPHRDNIHVLITGMDCQDCASKVNKAALRLPGVQPIAFDYINATAEFYYDSDTISAESIAKYIARATGFGIGFTSKSQDEDNGNILQTLRLSLDREPSGDLLSRYDAEIVHGPGTKRSLQICFQSRGPNATLPRDIMREFEPYGVTLLPEVSTDEERVSRDLWRISMRTMACAILTIPVLVLSWANLPPRPIVYGAILLTLATFVEILSWPLISSCIRSVIYLHQMDLSVLVAVSTLTAWIFSVVAFAFLCTGRPFAEPYFETVTLLVTLVFVGKVIQVATRRSSGSAVRRLQALQQPEVLLHRQVNGETTWETLDARLLHYSDTIRIKPATLIPTDGIVTVGISEVEESYVTGESIPVLKKAGDLVRAGTLNLDGVLDVEITSLVHDNSLAKVTALVNHAQAARSKYQDLADRLSAIVLPIATFAALASFLIWLLVNRFAQGRSWADSVVNAISYAIAIMAVSCPCALGLAVPTVVSAITRIGIREGVFYRSAEALQRGHHIDVVAFDKTGTLSEGIYIIAELYVLMPEARRLVLGITSLNAHPISLAIAANLETQGVGEPLKIQDLVVIPGLGVKAAFRGFPLLAGSLRFTNTQLHPLVAAYTASGLTILTVTLGHNLAAIYGLADRPRAGAEQLINRLRTQGKQIIMLSGDHTGAVQSFANLVNLPETMTRASCSPVDKASIITSYQSQGLKVCFVGDGVNDSVAMSTADLSLSLVAGSEIAKASSDVILLGSDLNRNVSSALSAAEVCHLHIILAITWCVIYGIFAILLASGATVKFRIAPQWAGLGEVISIIPIVIIAATVPLTWRIKDGLRKMQ